jgi:predicted nucleotidyltransferase
MAKIPKRPEEIFPEIIGDYKNIFGEDLISIILYGSAAGEDYIPGKSDFNFLVVLTEQGIERLDRVMETVGKWRKRNVAIPLFMTREYLTGALDAYPIEFLNMKNSYRVVTGEDLLAPLAFDSRHIRLQLEREFRGKLLLLRSGYLETEGKPKRIRDLIGASITAFISLFGALLYLKDLEIPKKKSDIIAGAAVAFGFDAAVFQKCEEIREETNHFSSAEAAAIFQDYLKEVRHLCMMIDRMETGEGTPGS